MEERGLQQDRRRGVRHRHDEQAQAPGALPQGHGDLDPRAAGHPARAQLPPDPHEHHPLEELAHGGDPLRERGVLAPHVRDGPLEPAAHPVARGAGPGPIDPAADGGPGAG